MEKRTNKKKESQKRFFLSQRKDLNGAHGGKEWKNRRGGESLMTEQGKKTIRRRLTLMFPSRKERRTGPALEEEERKKKGDGASLRGRNLKLSMGIGGGEGGEGGKETNEKRERRRRHEQGAIFGEKKMSGKKRKLGNFSG